MSGGKQTEEELREHFGPHPSEAGDAMPTFASMFRPDGPGEVVENRPLVPLGSNRLMREIAELEAQIRERDGVVRAGPVTMDVVQEGYVEEVTGVPVGERVISRTTLHTPNRYGVTVPMVRTLTGERIPVNLPR